MIKNILFDTHTGVNLTTEYKEKLLTKYQDWLQPIEDEINSQNATLCIFIDQIDIPHFTIEGSTHELNLKLARLPSFY